VRAKAASEEEREREVSSSGARRKRGREGTHERLGRVDVRLELLRQRVERRLERLLVVRDCAREAN